jgi:EAL domain-containing protein (putative c-di-GMP-specific phosphodiesterase class I)
MAVIGSPVPIESDEHILRARRTAGASRLAMGAIGIAMVLGRPGLVPHRLAAVIGFATILISAAVPMMAPRLRLLTVEESLSAGAGVLIVGLGFERVDVVTVLWLVAVASGVLARGGRVHWVGRYVLLLALALPVIRTGTLDASYGAMCVATISLLLTSGRLTSELNLLLRQARLQADSAETLLLAGDIAARMADRDGHEAPTGRVESIVLGQEELASARAALAKLIEGEGLEMVVQPIVDILDGSIHAFEALARFGAERPSSTPLHWFALAERLGVRPALERACLREALDLLWQRPAGTSLSVNLSAPVLLEARTLAVLEEAAQRSPDGLDGLIVEITEETLVDSDERLREAIAPLIASGARLAVDDMGAGYSGLRQITSVRPAYLKLDRALATGIDADPERAALVSALAGYARQVGARLVVEGIETTAELQTLRTIGVQFVQGYRLGRPGAPWPSVDARDARGAGAVKDEVLAPAEEVGRAGWSEPRDEGFEVSAAPRPLTTV